MQEYFTTVGADEDAPRRYRWLYQSNPHGVARTYVVVERATDNPVGITSLFPRAVQVGSDRVMGAIGGDAFVTPRFRRRGLATKLHRLALADLDDDLAFMFGPPEPNNLKALLQAGAVATGAVRRYTRPLRPRALGGFARKHESLFGAVASWFAPKPSALAVEYLDDAPDSRVDRVWEAVAANAAKSGAVIPVRDAAFYAWRFNGSVSRRQRGVLVLDGTIPVGVGAIERAGSRAAIVDVTCEPWRFKPVVAALLDACRSADSVDLQIHVPSHRKEATIASLGFIPRLRKTFQVQARPTFAQRSLITRPDAWEYTWGDGDVDHVL